MEVSEDARKQQNFDIGLALNYMVRGSKVAREGWQDARLWIAMQIPDEKSKMGVPYIYFHAAEGYLVPWTCSQVDLLSMDWRLVP